MTFKKLQLGKTYYAVSRRKMGNTSIRTVAVHPVVVTSLDSEKESVTASWNGNPPKQVAEKDWKSWRAEKPILIPSGFGHRLATRAEIKARTGSEAGHG